jgi:transposase-like protein
MVELKAMEEISKITTTVVCPCDRALKKDIPISLHKKNEYMCEGCNKKISIILEPKTALLTEPMDRTLLDDKEFLKEVEQKVKEEKYVL